MYKQYCAACHVVDAKHGSAAWLKTPPPDLIRLANRHNGKFPDDYLSDVLLLGPIAAHGSAAMPTWRPLFLNLDKRSETVVRQPISDLCKLAEDRKLMKLYRFNGPKSPSLRARKKEQRPVPSQSDRDGRCVGSWSTALTALRF